MTVISLPDLQARVRNTAMLSTLDEFVAIACDFLDYARDHGLARVTSPTHPHYDFYLFRQGEQQRISRPINTQLFFTDSASLRQAHAEMRNFLSDLEAQHAEAQNLPGRQAYLATRPIDRVIYTLQQTIGCIGDSFEEVNQSRKRAGQIFETLIKRILQEIGIKCEHRTIRIAIPGYPGYSMSYELDIVFSDKAPSIASETMSLQKFEVIGSVKTTSKDRIDKIFLDKYLLTQLLGRPTPMIANFLHDVQRSQISANARTGQQASPFGIASTFKPNHFLGYSVALTRLDGVYYIDPRPEMAQNTRLRELIHDFQQFLVTDIWALVSASAVEFEP